MANGPPWIIAGVPSKCLNQIWFNASRRRTVIAPWAFRSLAKTGLSVVMPTKIFPSLSLRSIQVLCNTKCCHNLWAAVIIESDCRVLLPSVRRVNDMSRNDLSFISLPFPFLLFWIDTPISALTLYIIVNKRSKRLWAFSRPKCHL